MLRRTLLRGIIFVGAGSSIAIGSNAFNTVKADRTIKVAIADDDEAYLKLTQRGTGERSETDGVPEVIEFSIPGDDEADYGGTDPQGVGADSIYRFDNDVADDEPGLFGVKNLGSQPVEIFSTPSSDSEAPTVGIFDVETEQLLTETNPSPPLGVGEQIICGLQLNTHDVEAGDYDVTLSIHADAPD